MDPRSEPEPDWLPDVAHAWLNEHRDVLEVVFDAFDRTRSWPDPLQLQRELLHGDHDIDLASAIDVMPSALGARQRSPERVVLSLFALRLVPAARDVLERYVRVLHVALERFSQPQLPNRVSRDDVVTALELDETAADRLSCLILSDCPFLGSGDAGLRSWDLEIDARIVGFRNDTTLDGFLGRLADIRALRRQPNPFGPQMSLPPAQPDPDPKSGASQEKPRSRRHVLKRIAQTTGAIATAVLVGLLTGWLNKGVEAVTGGEPLGIDVERDPARFDGTLPVDWERYDYIVDRPIARLPAAPKGTCRERFAWSQRLGGTDALRSKIRIYLRGRSDEPVIVQGLRLKAQRNQIDPDATHVACPVSGAVPNPLMVYVNLDRPSVRYGRIDEPPRRFLLTLSKGEVETLEVQAMTTRYDASWSLELETRVGDDRKVFKVDDGGKPFRTSAPPPTTVVWERGRWRSRPDARQNGPLP